MHVIAFGLGASLPLLLGANGGCAQLQDTSVTALETAAQSILDAALQAFFQQYNSGQSTTT